MRDFFKGWRRKAACMTLALACAFMAGWVRSLSVMDYITVPFGTIGSGLFISDDGCFVFTWSTSPGDAIADWQTGRQSDVEELGPIEYPPEFQDVEVPTENEPDKRNILERLTQSFRGMTFQRVGSDAHWLALYWPFVGTLTFLSACLLISKPRKSVQSKSTEPITNEGRAR